ncbi:putative isoleucine--tRNA ligase [Helianthus anomalus]
MVFKGYIYRGRKPVHWSPSSRTALAEAELEYPEGHVSKSMYAIFRLFSTPTKNGLLDEFLPKLSLAVWTTTPWTIPANAVVAVNAKPQYAIVEVQPVSPDVASSSEDKNRRFGSVLKEQEAQFFIVAVDLVPTLEAKWNVKLVKKTVLGSDLENCRYAHPINGQECPVVILIGGDYITTESGTRLVHTAPGHGQYDYLMGLKYDLPIISPVDDEGKFTEEAGIFKGFDVLGDGNAAVIDHLDERVSIVMVEPYNHKYPYDWRTKKPTIFRATAQWFALKGSERLLWMRSIKLHGLRSSWAAVLESRNGLRFPVDLYVEGKAPYSGVITHGFVLDEKGLKMSKSLGNVVDPRTVIEGGKNQEVSGCLP